MGPLAGTSGKSLRCGHGLLAKCQDSCPQGASYGSLAGTFSDNFLTGLVQSQFAGSHPQSHGVSRSGLGPRMCISSKFLGAAAAAGPQTTL